MTKTAYLLGPNGEEEPLPKFITFHNDTQAFEAFTMANALAGEY